MLFLAPLPVPAGSTSGLDKIAHATIFGLLLVSSFKAYPRRSKVFLVAALAAYALGVELAQGTTLIARNFEWRDILADLTGLVLGIGVISSRYSKDKAQHPQL